MVQNNYILRKNPVASRWYKVPIKLPVPVRKTRDGLFASNTPYAMLGRLSRKAVEKNDIKALSLRNNSSILPGKIAWLKWLMVYCQGHPNCRQGKNEICCPGCYQRRQDACASQRDEDGVDDKIGEADAYAETDSQRNSA